MTAVARIFILSNIVALGSIAYMGSLQDMRCDYLLQIVDDCWDKYTSLPSCNNLHDPLVKCAYDQRNAAERMECADNIQDTLKLLWTIYVTLKETMCSDQKLHDEFLEKSSCWTNVRECALVFAATPVQEGLQTHKCNVIFEEMQECNKKAVTSCTNVLHRFAAVMASRTPCSEHMEVPLIHNDATRRTFAVLPLLLSTVSSLSIFI